MALIEELIKTIADPRLRDQVAGEVAKLKAKKKFGLVFEEFGSVRCADHSHHEQHGNGPRSGPYVTTQ